MNIIQTFSNWWNGIIICPVCLGEGRLVKTGNYGEEIYCQCVVCDSTGYTKYLSIHSVERLILQYKKGGFRAIDGEYITRNDLFKTLYVRKRK